MRLKLVFSIAALLLALASCTQKKEFEAYRSLSADGWHNDSLVVFDVELGDTIESHNLYLNLRNSGSYPFSNLWLFVNISSPDGKVLTDTLNFQLAAPSGKWLGTGIGDLFDNQFLYKENIYFPTPGIYRFSIQQGMRANRLKGIRDIGISIEKQN
ncbi:gliding motility lipoprotein GldH [Mangrovibacterium marinum]|uniref:Protein involved in gliding motility GldH n=1 Tax=Mangrovibacterium marinum TaxID=1639118 RepID=A0A2T5C6K9_9BACT|nr:gliding motility lipoprotein GldH [Mangrovibacterium marinum]PTN10585.1 protein involved in gliding motility GldH [Mangrovibacterium marinum]